MRAVSASNPRPKGGFKPSGRSKPASEYLAQSAREGRFPFINNLVDATNYLSLKTGFPMGILDLAIMGESPLIRYGRAGEKYVFNSVGQEIELQGLICVCAGPRGEEVPLANPIKDSMRAKIKAETRDVLGLINASTRLISPAELERYVQEFATLLERYGHGQVTQAQVLSGART